MFLKWTSVNDREVDAKIVSAYKADGDSHNYSIFLKPKVNRYVLEVDSEIVMDPEVPVGENGQQTPKYYYFLKEAKGAAQDLEPAPPPPPPAAESGAGDDVEANMKRGRTRAEASPASPPA